ncbi:hypothetical protein B0A58_12915 [Flavobacterium branchiophilum NBRC 15030 = ATCC 35035]|uniref:Uncharacterized protein n=1 Tax=Flavobacterium branchiophilum TaxID=55197 RepID=A0A543G3H9_9FLAO|nr:hypothetical protein [Flavobacterium branchiophilum]OXA72240.1 hypothetical protein B0A58_12915 [Flavobacterium branchiophilum NBRC 15030 = ATCC 35035]TQM40605.1 hypothetical protein BC670_1503 [Flavobacterium branchiophilum]
MKDFFYKYWWLYYLLFFFLLGILIYALMWQPICVSNKDQILDLQKQLEDCRGTIRKDSVVYIQDTTQQKKQIIDCDATVKSGGQGETETIHSLGNKSGKVIIDFDMNSIPDEMIVYFNNQEVASTKGTVKGKGSLEFDFDAAKSSSCIVIVKAPQNNTEWKYIVNCPK